MAERRIVVVEAYQGLLETIASDAAERAAARGLGLPLGNLAERLGATIVVLHWDEFEAYEWHEPWPISQVRYPATRPTGEHVVGPPAREPIAGVVWHAIPARDPETGAALHPQAFSPRAQEMIFNGDYCFFAGWCLARHLEAMQKESGPPDLVVVPSWGGLGYAAQMRRATGVAEAVRTPFAVVACGVSGPRHEANGEGLWTRAGVVRRQDEDLSLALADVVLSFGEVGDAQAAAARVPGSPAPVRMPRAIASATIDGLRAAADRPGALDAETGFYLHEPFDGASGMLLALDATERVRRRNGWLGLAVRAGGPDTRYAPMKPRSFADYWSSRGWVRTLMQEARWAWCRAEELRTGGYPVRLMPSVFEHLPAPWETLARGDAVVLSPAAAEGVLPGEPIDETFRCDTDPDALADRLRAMRAMPRARLDDERRRLCRRVVEWHAGPARDACLQAAAAALGAVMQAPAPPALGAVALGLLDRRLPSVRRVAARPSAPDSSGLEPGTLGVVITCYDLGAMVEEAVESVWGSRRVPDQVVLVDDGSSGEETTRLLVRLEARARRRKMPLEVLRQSNRGLAGARNAGLARLETEFVSFLDGDDRIHGEFYALAESLLRAHPDLGGVAAWARLFGPGVFDSGWNAPQPELPFALVENPVFVPCLMRTAVVRALGGVDESQRHNYEDWELTVRLLGAGWPIVTIPAHLEDYRIRQDSLLRTMTDSQNQSMRERLLARHRPLAERFGPEVALQIEHRWRAGEYHAEGEFDRLRRENHELRVWVQDLRAALRSPVFAARYAWNKLSSRWNRQQQGGRG